MPLAPEDIGAILFAVQTERDRRETQIKYYKGEHAIAAPGAGGTNKDGTPRVAKVHNLIRKCVNRHVGFAFGQPVQLVSKMTANEQAEGEEAPKPGLLARAAQAAKDAMSAIGVRAPATAIDEDSAGAALDEYERVREWNELDAVDPAHYKDAMIDDVSFEVYSFEKPLDAAGNNADAKIVITKMPVGQCIGIFDSDGYLRVLIRHVTVPAHTFWDGEYVMKQRNEVWVYDDEQTAIYEEAGVDKEKAAYTLKLRPVAEGRQNPEPNIFKTVLAVAFRVSPTMDPFIGKRAIELQDHYNNLLSSQGNAIIEDQKENWIVTGFQGTDENKKTFKEMLSQNIIWLPDATASAERVTGGAEVEDVKDNRDWTRQAIFETLGAADTEKIVGSTGSASGIALRLAHAPMAEAAAPMIDEFQRCIRRRVDLLNTINKVLQRPVIEDYQVRMKTQILINETELWANIPTLSQALALEDVISLAVPSIDDPKAAAARKEEERNKQLERDVMLRDSPAPINAPVPAQIADRVAQKAQAEAVTVPKAADRLARTTSALSDKDAEKLVAEARKLGVGANQG